MLSQSRTRRYIHRDRHARCRALRIFVTNLVNGVTRAHTRRGRESVPLTLHAPHFSRIILSPLVARYSSLGAITRQMHVAPARSGIQEPKASITIQPS